MRQDIELLKVQRLVHSEALFDFADSPTEAHAPEGNPATHEIPSSVATALLEIHEYERRRIGQELHDSAGQLLVALQLSVARLRAIDANCEHDGLINEIQDTVRQIDREMRTLAFLHHPAEIGDRSLLEALGGLAQGFGRRTGIRTSFRCVGNFATLPEPISVDILRIAQEALVNVHRHSRATAAKVVLRIDRDRLRLTVSDNGIGMPSGSPDVPGVGLLGMRHRMEMHGGNFHVTKLRHGTKVCATVPLGIGFQVSGMSAY